jgi:capsular exopolysaccharide synthesis family protein
VSILRDLSESPATDGSTGPMQRRTFKNDPHLVMKHHPNSPIAERFRRLRLSLELKRPGASTPRQLTVITSAIPGEGKTTTALNLALAMAEDRRHRTLFVDADLRRASASRYVTPLPRVGLSEVLAGDVTLDAALIALADSDLWVLPAGTPTATPLSLLQAGRLACLIAELRRRFDRIVVDTPPTVPFTDAAVLVAHADDALLVVRAGTTTKSLVRRAKDSLIGARALGVVLNDVAFTTVDRYYDKYDEYRPA